MRILVVLAGVPVASDSIKGELLLPIMTLSEGEKYFRFERLINNWQTLQSLIEVANNKGHEIIYKSFSNRKHPLHLLRGALAIRRIVKAESVDIVHIFWGGASAFAASLCCPCPLIISFMGSDLLGDYTSKGHPTLFGRFLIFLSKMAAARAEAVIVMSAQMKREIWPSGRGKAFIIPEGIDLVKFVPKKKAACRAIIGIKSNLPIVLFFNSNRNVKNAPLAHEIFRQVQLQVPDAQLLEVADVPHSQLVNYYNAADVLLLTSLHEGSNNSIKEAMACNCPVVCTPSGDAALRLAGVAPSFVATDWEPQPLAQAIISLLHSPARSNGRDMVVSVALPNIAEQLLSAYEVILSKKHQ